MSVASVGFRTDLNNPQVGAVEETGALATDVHRQREQSAPADQGHIGRLRHDQGQKGGATGGDKVKNASADGYGVGAGGSVHGNHTDEAGGAAVGAGRLIPKYA